MSRTQRRVTAFVVMLMGLWVVAQASLSHAGVSLALGGPPISLAHVLAVIQKVPFLPT